MYEMILKVFGCLIGVNLLTIALQSNSTLDASMAGFMAGIFMSPLLNVLRFVLLFVADLLIGISDFIDPNRR
jgi:hypothetical protein